MAGKAPPAGNPAATAHGSVLASPHHLHRCDTIDRQQNSFPVANDTANCRRSKVDHLVRVKRGLSSLFAGAHSETLDHSIDIGARLMSNDDHNNY